MTQEQNHNSDKFAAAANGATNGIVVYENTQDPDHIRIENLNIRLPGQQEPLISNVNLSIPRGARVLVTGESGSGKTTLVKSILGLWNYGEGRVAIPEGHRVMTIPQIVYLPNMQLRNILNMAPEGKEVYDDRDLRRALQSVNLGKLVQHIPGQQVEVLMDDVLKVLDEQLASGAALDDVRKTLDQSITDLVAAQFEVVQFVRPQEREYFKAGLQKLLANRAPEVAATVAGWEDGLIEKIDLQLVAPMCRIMSRIAPSFAVEAQTKKVFAHDAGSAARFAANLKRDFVRRMDDFINNRDTEDPSREVRLNMTQAAHVAAHFAAEVEQALLTPVQKTPLCQIYNAASMPLRLPMQLLKPVPARLMKDLMYNVGAFMEAQIVRGDKLSARLSGGQKKMLMAACVLLAKPGILLLDEVPSGLDAKNGLQVYKDIMNAIPKDATVISIIHHEEQFVPFHSHHVRVADKTAKMTTLAKTENRPQGPQPG